MINVRTKGATFERQIAKKLNEFFEKKNNDLTSLLGITQKEKDIIKELQELRNEPSISDDALAYVKKN